MRCASPTLLATALILSTCSVATGQTKRDATAVAKEIDRAITKRLVDGNHPVAPDAEDAEFVRLMRCFG